MNKSTRIFILICGSCVFIYALYFVSSDFDYKKIKQTVKFETFNENKQKDQDLRNENNEIELKEAGYLSSCKNKVKQNNKKSIWTFLTDGDGYHKSAIKLIKSIKAHTTVQDFDTLVLEIKEKPLPDSVKQSLLSNGWQICLVDRIAPRDEAKTHGTFRDQFTKLVLWKFTEYEAIYYFDSDAFVIRNIDSFLKIYKNFNSSIKIGVTRDIRENGWVTTFNMGVFVIKPDREELTKLLILKNDPNFVFETIMSEQGFLNVAYKNQWYEIGFENNANLAVFTMKPDYWKEREDKINVIHFTMSKPWVCGGVYKQICKYWEDLN